MYAPIAMGSKGATKIYSEFSNHMIVTLDLQIICSIFQCLFVSGSLGDFSWKPCVYPQCLDGSGWKLSYIDWLPACHLVFVLVWGSAAWHQFHSSRHPSEGKGGSWSECIVNTIDCFFSSSLHDQCLKLRMCLICLILPVLSREWGNDP